MDTATATSADFAPLIGDTFVSTLADGSRLDLELTDCADLPANPRATQGFSLVFRHGSADVYPQHIHALSHDGLGDLELFLVPIGQDEEGIYYEALFSRPPATP